MNEQIIFYTAFLAAGAIIALAVFSFFKKPDNKIAELTKQIDGVKQQLTDGMKSNTDMLNVQMNAFLTQFVSAQNSLGVRMDSASEVVSRVHKELGELSEASKKIFEVGKNISALEDILKAPKFRGNLGEFLLEDLLAQILPIENYELQYKFKSGEQVDAVVKLSQGIVPIDSKFPLESFRRMLDAKDDVVKKAEKKEFVSAVKKHIDAIAKKYIKPDENTFDFALMYIPAENIYYEVIIKDEEVDGSIGAYAFSKKVVAVSANSFYAYLQVIAQGLKGLKVEKEAAEIIGRISRIKGDFDRFFTEFETLGGHIQNTKTKYDLCSQRAMQLGGKITSVTDGVEKLSENNQ